MLNGYIVIHLCILCAKLRYCAKFWLYCPKHGNTVLSFGKLCKIWAFCDCAKLRYVVLKLGLLYDSYKRPPLIG